jgi:hypothetical protein
MSTGPQLTSSGGETSRIQFYLGIASLVISGALWTYVGIVLTPSVRRLEAKLIAAPARSSTRLDVKPGDSVTDPDRLARFESQSRAGWSVARMENYRRETEAQLAELSSQRQLLILFAAGSGFAGLWFLIATLRSLFRAQHANGSATP